MDTTIDVHDVTKAYAGHTVLDSVSFTVPPGRVVAFLGPNGSGKSTTLRILLGLAKANAGSATIGDLPYAALATPARTVGVMMDNAGLHPGRTAAQHLRIAALASDIDPRRIQAVLATVGLDTVARRKIKTFSLGMKQRLGLAAALLGDPKILVLDEPANGLDPQGVHWLRDFLRSFANDGGSVLVTSHILAEVEQVADDVVLIDRGRVVASGPIHELIELNSLEHYYLSVLGRPAEALSMGEVTR
ncbi:MAG: ATP-binding cassette domain-containing protein [Propionibacteriaceae bacterium]